MREKRSHSDGVSSSEFWEVSHAAARLTEYACVVSAQHLKDSWTRMQFNRELAYYAKRVVEDVYERRISPEEGLKSLVSEKNNLKAQSERIISQTIGVVGATGQIITGAGICYGSLGLLCAVAGAPLVAHGSNNFYENARGLYEGRGDIQGPVRKAYQGASKKLGHTEREGDLAYLASDVVLSVGVLARDVVKPGGWKLFNYYRVDKEMAVLQMGKGALAVEGVSNANTAAQFYEAYER